MTDRPYLHELLLLGLGVALALWLALRTGLFSVATSRMIVAVALFAAATRGLAALDGVRHAFRVRLVLAYVFTFFLYASPKWAVPALGLALRDDWLLAADTLLFGGTPAVLLQGVATPLVADVLSACYLGFHGYLHGAMAWALVGPRARAERFFGFVFAAYAPGLAGYFLVPAVGPAVAFAEQFTTPLAGGLLTRLNASVIASGTSVYDLFPSLHTCITLVLLEHDRLAHPRRFRLLLPLGAAIVVSTIVLRYHYAADVLAGALLFAGYRLAHPRLERWWSAPPRVESAHPAALP